jgi:hypothetical protein
MKNAPSEFEKLLVRKYLLFKRRARNDSSAMLIANEYRELFLTYKNMLNPYDSLGASLLEECETIISTTGRYEK